MNVVLKPAIKEAWIAFYVAHGVLSKKIDARLVQAGVVTLDIYDVLLTLEMAENQRLKMSELADRVLVTRSGMTRMVDRLEGAGLIERQSFPGDRRSLFAVLTPKGLAERERAWPVYEKAIADLFAVHVSEEQAITLSNTLGPCGGSRGLD